MPCDTRLKQNQTITERKDEILRTVQAVQQGLVNGRIKAKIGPQGAIAFDGLLASERNDVTDVCIYRRLMSTGSSLARMQIAKAEQLAGRSVSAQAVSQGAHSHDGGHSWHSHKG
jgi:hypothetical protein